MKFNRSAVCEPYLEMYSPKPEDPFPAKEDKTLLYKDAIDILMRAAQEKKTTIHISYGQKGSRWRMKAGFFKSSHPDFLRAAGALLEQMYNIQPK